MIHFKSCEWKNFLSTANDPIKILLDKSPTTLIVGQNGAGKSTLLDAMSFALFNKPHRDINKNQLINSINQKKTEVTVEFNIGNKDFKIVRGIKPAKFEIWQNGNLINQASNARDYQKFLEQNILKLNHKSFHQVVVLGSSSFIPFMQLPAWSRRSVIEDLLDINIFSKMNTLLKERNTKIKDELVDINHQIELLKTKITAQSKYIKDLESLNQDQIEKKRDSIKVHKTTIKETFEESKELGKGLETLLKEEEKRHKDNLQQSSQLNSLDLNYNQKIKDLVEQARFYEENDHCPTCDQDVGPELKEKKIQIIQNDAKGIQQEKAGVEKELANLKKEMQDIADKTNQLKQKQQRINSNNERISVVQKEIDKIQKEINQLNSQTGDTGTAKKELKESRKSKEAFTEKKLEYVEERTYNEVIGEMLKDTGIKTKVIKQYLPVMNRLINQYLQILDFFVAFHLDENFN